MPEITGGVKHNNKVVQKNLLFFQKVFILFNHNGLLLSLYDVQKSVSISLQMSQFSDHNYNYSILHGIVFSEREALI